MPLSGLDSNSARPRGGVERVELVPASEYAADKPSSGFAWAFREDRARYTEETAGGSALSALVKHTLIIELAATPESRRAAGELADTSVGQGVVAVVTMASGEVVVAGYSSRFGALYPLRITASEYSSGNTPADFPTITLTLQSVY